jgi:nucleotide-binding universal stress UspA family protein
MHARGERWLGKELARSMRAQALAQRYVRRPLARRRVAAQNAEVELCVATDLSPSADPAVQLALRWAERLGASVLLLHIVHDPELAPAFTSDVPGDVARARAALQQFAAGVLVPCRVEVRTADRVADAIVEAGSACAYLFVGSHGKSGFQRLRLGSVATSVLQRSRVPVVCLPAPAPGGNAERGSGRRLG